MNNKNSIYILNKKIKKVLYHPHFHEVLALLFFLFLYTSHAQEISYFKAKDLHTISKIGELNSSTSNSFTKKDVILLQIFLSQEKSLYPSGRVTGIFGNQTRKALLNFQNTYNIERSASLDETTSYVINKMVLDLLCPKPVIQNQSDLFYKKILKDKDPVPIDYIPDKLVILDDFENINVLGIVCVDERMTNDLNQMFIDAKSSGIDLAISSGFRRSEIQEYLNKVWEKNMGETWAFQSAKPGYSEHQLGTAIDMTDASINYEFVSDRFDSTLGGEWMKNNSYKYGFTLSYPPNKRDKTGFDYEPWHYRYLGKEIANYLHQNNLLYIEQDLY